MSARAQCPKCLFTSGDDWRQCNGSCPMPGSPHYEAPVKVLEPKHGFCGACDGSGEVPFKVYEGPEVVDDGMRNCDVCGGTGESAAPVPTTWRERVEAERFDADVRVRALDALFDTPEVFAKVPANQQRLLSAQRLAMHTYLGCLEVRLKDGDVDPYTLEPIDRLRTAAATLNEAMVTHGLIGAHTDLLRAVAAWRRAWLQVDGRELRVGDVEQPPVAPRKAHSYERRGKAC